MESNFGFGAGADIFMKKTITDIPGVYANGTHCGIKPDKQDLAFIYVPSAVASAGVFTRNLFPAACVGYTKNCIEKHVVKAVIINSGNANAGTGKQGIEDNKTMAKLTALELGLKPYEVAVASTGKIGMTLQ